MSTNIQMKKVCEQCGEIFMARTAVTRYCSHKCNSRAYKIKQRQEKIKEVAGETKLIIGSRTQTVAQNDVAVELVSMKQLSIITSLSERTLFRMMKDAEFPKIKIGKRLIFNKDAVIKFINNKYGSI